MFVKNIIQQKRLLLLASFLFVSCLSAAGQDYIPASCYGGEKQFREFFKEELVYPESALKNKEEGLVVLLFIVNADGSVRNLRVWQSAGAALDSEAVRIFRLLQWNPAIYHGKPKAMEQFLKFRFKLSKYEKICKSRGYRKIEYPYLPIDSSTVIYKYEEVEAAPVFQGTQEENISFERYFGKVMKYPETAFQQSITGTVKIDFVVETSGRISNVLICKNLGGGCDSEVRRFFKRTRWAPGKVDGKAVRVQMHYAVNFEMRDGYQYITYAILKS